MKGGGRGESTGVLTVGVGALPCATLPDPEYAGAASESNNFPKLRAEIINCQGKKNLDLLRK